MHRSGTSALAKVFADAGFDAGSNLIPADEHNPTGYWEDREIFNLNNQILSQLFLSWDQPEKHQNRRIHIFADELMMEFGQRAVDLLQRKFSQSSQVLIKDPRFMILLPFWKQVFALTKNIRIIPFHIFRNPLAVANSLNRRNGLSINNAILLWYHYNFAFLNDRLPETTVVNFEELLNFGEGFLNSAVLKANPEFAAMKPSIALNPLLNHHTIGKDELRWLAEKYPEVYKMWDFLIALAGNPDVPINENDLVQFRNPDIYKLTCKEEKQEKIQTTLVFQPDTTEAERKIINGVQLDKNTFLYSLEKEGCPLDNFKVYIGDKPSKITDVTATVTTESGNLTLKPGFGNYLISTEDVYWFHENLPFFRFQLPEPFMTKQITLTCKLFEIGEEDTGIMLAALNSKNATLNQKLNELSASYIEAKSQVAEAKSQSAEAKSLVAEAKSQSAEAHKGFELQLLKKDNEIIWLKNAALTKEQKLQSQIEKQITEIAGLEKKSLWLFNELNKAKDSLSWKITAPLRKFQVFGNKVSNKLFILRNDIGASYRLLRREGTGYFMVRLIWYLRGKRLKEQIEFARLNNHPEEKKHVAAVDTSATLIFKKTTSPKVSVIIPLFNHFETTYRCLQSILKNTIEIDFEVILIDDYSTEKVFDFAEKIKGVSIIRNTENLGFLRSCNKAAAEAKGEYICFLNNDTEPHEGWLRHIIDLLDKNAKIAIAGPKLVYPDGRLQEAGGIIWNDASAWNFGKYDDAGKPDYNYLKEVDYISGACLVIRKPVWEKVNGFDEHFAPAYYEDTDLAMRVHQAGFKVFYQPLSMVTHHEGISNGCNEHSGIKKYQTINQQKFYQKWSHELQVESSPNGINVFFHRDRSLHQKHILVIDHYVPIFDHDAGSRSTFGYLKLLLKMGFKIHFIGDNYFKHEPYTTILQQMGIEVLYGNFYQENIRDWFRENGQYISFVIAHRVHIAPKYFDMIRKFTTAKLAYVGHDLQYLGSKRKFDVTGDKKFIKEHARFLKTETEIFNAVDVILPFSTYEEPYIKKLAPEKTVQVIPVYFFENIPEKVPGFDERHDILFVGYFGHPPNPDAILWFVKEVFPFVHQNIPDAKLHVVGSQPTEEVLKLRSESINITGFVSDEELTRYYQTCKVAILPLRFGAGVKGKLLESLHHQIPTVITSVAAEGVPEIENYSLIADNARDFAEKIKLLYQDKNVWEKYSAGGKELIEKYYTEEVAGKLLEKILPI